MFELSHSLVFANWALGGAGIGGGAPRAEQTPTGLPRAGESVSQAKQIAVVSNLFCKHCLRMTYICHFGSVLSLLTS